MVNTMFSSLNISKKTSRIETEIENIYTNKANYI